MVKAVLFDCDGVLIDSYSSTIEFLQTTFRHFHLPVPDKETFLPLLGNKTPDIIRILQPQLTEEEFETVYTYSMKESLKIARTIALIPHVQETLTTLSTSYKLGVISNRGKESLHFLLNKHNLMGYFGVVLAREDVTLQKPHPEPLEKALKTLGVTNQEAVFVGDTAIDQAAAKAAQVTSIIYNSSDKTLGDHQISDLRAISERIKRL